MTNNIPVLHVEGRCLAEAYERALCALHERGARLKTQYDKPGDPESLDSTMNITVHDPLAEPMIHKAFPGGIEDLREYVMELQGAKDHWVKNINDPADTRWEYTYHGRLAAYGMWREKRTPTPGAGVPSRREPDLHKPEHGVGAPRPQEAGSTGTSTSVETGFFRIDQIEAVIAKLASQPYTRQAQMITWMPSLDLDCYDPPCLQSIWYRIMEDDAGGWWLNCNIRFRSNDAWGANFMNMFGFILFNRDIVAAEVARRTGRTVRLARLNWQADSYHIYGKDILAARQRLFDRLATSTLEDRTYRFTDPMIQEIDTEAEAVVREKIRVTDGR